MLNSNRVFSHIFRNQLILNLLSCQNQLLSKLIKQITCFSGIHNTVTTDQQSSGEEHIFNVEEFTSEKWTDNGRENDLDFSGQKEFTAEIWTDQTYHIDERLFSEYPEGEHNDTYRNESQDNSKQSVY